MSDLQNKRLSRAILILFCGSVLHSISLVVLLSRGFSTELELSKASASTKISKNFVSPSDGLRENVAYVFKDNKFYFAREATTLFPSLFQKVSEAAPATEAPAPGTFVRIATLDGAIEILSSAKGFDMNHNQLREFVLQRRNNLWNSIFDVYESPRNNTFVRSHTLQVPGDASFYDLGDQGDGDNDGLSELLFYGREGDSFFLKLYESPTTSTYPTNLVWQTSQPGWPVGVKIADADSDGKKEIVVGGWPSPTSSISAVAVYENIGDNQYDQVYYQSFPEIRAPQSLAVAEDLDNDRKKEIIFGSPTPNSSRVYILENDGDDSYRVIWSVDLMDGDQIINASHALYVGDSDRDGRKEFIVGGLRTITPPVMDLMAVFRLFEADGDNQFSAVADLRVPLPHIFADYDVNVADVDADGAVEILVDVNNSVGIYRGVGDNVWNEIWHYNKTYTSYAYVGGGDNDRDGFEEFMFGDGANTAVYESSTAPVGE